jgi:hypothetical protein
MDGWLAAFVTILNPFLWNPLTKIPFLPNHLTTLFIFYFFYKKILGWGNDSVNQSRKKFKVQRALIKIIIRNLSNSIFIFLLLDQVFFFWLQRGHKAPKSLVNHTFYIIINNSNKYISTTFILKVFFFLQAFIPNLKVKYEKWRVFSSLNFWD